MRQLTFLTALAAIAIASPSTAAPPSLNRVRVELRHCGVQPTDEVYFLIKEVEKKARYESGFWIVDLGSGINPYTEGIVPKIVGRAAYCGKGKTGTASTGGAVADYVFECEQQTWQLYATSTADTLLRLYRAPLRPRANECIYGYFVTASPTPYVVDPVGWAERLNVAVLTPQGQVVAAYDVQRTTFFNDTHVVYTPKSGWTTYAARALAAAQQELQEQQMTLRGSNVDAK